MRFDNGQNQVIYDNSHCTLQILVTSVDSWITLVDVLFNWSMWGAITHCASYARLNRITQPTDSNHLNQNWRKKL